MALKIGIVGGIGPESTLDYYKGIIQACKKRGLGMNFPEVVLYSASLGELMELMDSGRWDELVDWLVAKLGFLQRAGADFAAIASNSPHLVFDQVARRSPLPLISIVEAARAQAVRLGLQQPGLLGTRFTMSSDFFPKVFAPAGLQLSVPPPAEQDLIHQRLFAEIELGIIKDSTRQELLAIVDGMKQRQGIDGLILGCTELPLILPEESYLGLPVINTTAVHVEAMVRCCLQGDAQSAL
ncbi:MAG: amino acid racemase [Deltaproteobacteria bacterium]|nr:amino acid racemase [Deltaproteobacteria bacterium]